MFELQSSQLVVKSSVKDEKTKTFAQHMIDDHTKTSTELKQQLQSNKAEGNLPKSMSKSQQKMLGRLKGLKGEALAAQYDKDQVAAHQKAVDLFRAYSNTGEDESLKAWAAKTLPALEDHLKMAQQLAK
jgi:putative membrane protein